MNIQQVVPSHCSNAITGFSKMLQGPDFFPFIRTYEFKFSGDFNFNLELLQKVLKHVVVAGAVKLSSEVEIWNILRRAFIWKVNAEGVIAKTDNERLVNARVVLFWGCLKEEFNEQQEEPMLHYFIHTPEVGSYFADTTSWSFCFVIANSKKGLVVSGKTWASPELCIAENPVEARFREAHGML